MFHPWPARWLATLPALAALTAVAQTVPATAAGADGQAPLSFRSAFDGYRPFKDEKAIAWKEANDAVRARGGWRAYAEEAAGQGSTGDGAPAQAADPHAGHAVPMPAQKESRP
ncbi:hypothetical protein [Variovorax sp. JS1663]|uniref:hypothetical protein n=1 Tax=Variovorax sp. JS1663 TaxID=1851577 RepID=UPI000B345B45|nr:hypothetical protein [Variovorax sp. JS1663]OUM01021.1 hypothetical protein A8M77_18125 [Variovorax sp. JS1663]